jgi:hypothetical protein
MNCPHCAAPLSERGVFCKACAGQAQCMKCRELLEPDAVACVECGTRVGQPVEASHDGVTQGSQALPPNRNTLSYSEDRNSRKFEASLTDSAMHGLGDVFGELFAQRGAGRVALPAGTRTLIRDVTTGETKELPASLPEPEEIVIAAKKTPQSAEKEKLLNVFTISGETIELVDNRLKAKSAADYYKRLTYLFIYAQDLLLGHPLAPKNELIVVLKEAKVYDANCRFWLKQKKGFTDSEDRMKLIAGAREQAAKALEEILDTNIVDEWNPDTKSTKPRAPRKKKATK